MNWDYKVFLSKMLLACENHYSQNWTMVQPPVENEFRGLLLMIEWLQQMKISDAINTEQALILLDIQKNTIRMRLISLPFLSTVEADHLLKHAIDSIRKDLYDQIDWVII